ncbi:unnamed protein product [Candidula unifasciata]|uniref:Major facilitator superfamily (MFS) profile domain-containing protein n=1 Tax=Candidula unifasciata TaxID=100452 RepID=A0A8S3YWJ6_9EUPU|nr:unnamed protein product [Candidula unifasciata]
MGTGLDRMPSNKTEHRQTANRCLEDVHEGEDEPGFRPPTPPDGGWGWMVVLASFLCNMIVDGVCFSFGVVAKTYQKEFAASHSMVGWVGSSLAGCYLLVGPFVSFLCVRYGCRKVTMIGSVVTMAGFIISTQASNVGMLIFTYGVIGGIGFGMVYLPSIVCVGYWFDKKRAFTTGIAVCGTGMGQFAFPPLAHYLLTEYGWEGKNLIMAGIVLHCAVCGMTFLPLDRQVEIERGAIMKALIEHKNRQRTTSNGSLDNCIITVDNRLIKLDQKLLECKRNNSFIARFKRQLGFSSQSLASSKTSIQGIPSIVIDAVQKDLNKTAVAASTPIYRPNGIRVPEDLSQSQLVSKRASLPDGSVLTSSSPLPNGTVPAANGGVKENGVAKTQSCEVIPSEENLWIGQSQDEGLTFKVKQVGSLPSVSHSASNLETLSFSPSADGSVISIQVIENSVCSKCSAHRYRSGHSVSSVYSSRMTSSKTSYVTGSVLSVPQSSVYDDDLEYDLDRHMSLASKCWQILCDMFDIRLMLSPVFALLVLSSFVTLLAFYVPFFYFPEKGVLVGMSESSATFLLSIVGITNTIGRLLCGWLADRPWVNTLHLNNSALILAGIALLFCPLCKSEEPLAALAAIFGLCVAVYVSLRSILLVDLLGLEMLTKSFGLLILFQGVAAFIGAPIAGRLRDTTGDLNNCFYFAGILTLCSGVLMLPISRLHRRAQQNKKLSSATSNDNTVTETLKLDTPETRI